MKRFVLIGGAMVLMVSLWFNWKNLQRQPAGDNISLPAAEVPPANPVSLGEIDFSGTGLSDESWQLKDPDPDLKIPAVVPDRESPAPDPAAPAWDPDVSLDIKPQDS